MVMVAVNGDGGDSALRTVLIKAGGFGRQALQQADGGRPDGANNGNFYLWSPDSLASFGRQLNARRVCRDGNCYLECCAEKK